MKKYLLAFCFFCFSTFLAGQKAWFLSAEVSPAVFSIVDYSNRVSSHPKKYGRITKPNFGIGGRIFRASEKVLQPEFGFEFRTLDPRQLNYIEDFPSGFEMQTVRQFGISLEPGVRLEEIPSSKIWRFSMGVGGCLWAPFLSKRENSFGEREHVGFFDPPRVGWSASISFARLLKNERRGDFGLQFMHYVKYFGSSFVGLPSFWLLKIRAAVSIDAVEKQI